MKQTLLLIFGLIGAMALQAQTPDLSGIKALVERVSPNPRKEVKPNAAREVISCTQETIFSAGTAPMSFDSTFRNINRIDENNGYRVLTQEAFSFDAVSGFELESSTLVYGVDVQGTFEGGFDSVVQFIPDGTGGLLVYVKIFPFYNGANQIERLDIYFNTAAFGLPFGLLLFGQNLFYYDANGYQVATASKQVDFGTFSLINADSSFFVNNSAGQVLEETDWQWDPDASAYEATYRYTYTYVTTGGDTESETIEGWDGSDWAYLSRNLYFYNKPGQVNRQDIQTGGPGAWETVQDIAYSYDVQDRLILELESNFDSPGVKTPAFRNLYTYDTPQGWLQESIGQYYELGNWINANRAILEDCLGTSSLDEVAADPTVKAWFNSARQLEFQLSEGSEARLVEVFDLTGRPVLVATPAAQQQVIDAARLQQGLYLVRISLTNGQSATRKAMQW